MNLEERRGMNLNERFEQARNWLGDRWLLAEPINKPHHAHVRTSAPNRWASYQQQIARILGGSEHV